MRHATKNVIMTITFKAVLIPLMGIGNVICVLKTYSYEGHNNQSGYYDMSFVDTDDTCYSTLGRL